jgi:RNA-directed DNA polymerase
MIAEKQKKLARTAVDNPEYRFSNLYDLLHWRPWIEEAARKVLSRKGSDTAGVDGKTRQHFMQDFEQNVENLRMELKRGTFEPMPTRRAYIPKGIKDKRPLGILTLNDRIVQEAMRTAIPATAAHLT